MRVALYILALSLCDNQCCLRMSDYVSAMLHDVMVGKVPCLQWMACIMHLFLRLQVNAVF